jgi:excisionase family DNA binding protein
MADEFVTTAQAAQIVGCSRRTIRRAYISGALIAHRDGNSRRVRIRPCDLREWMIAEPIPASAMNMAAAEPAFRSARSSRRSSLELLRAARATRS